MLVSEARDETVGQRPCQGVEQSQAERSGVRSDQERESDQAVRKTTENRAHEDRPGMGGKGDDQTDRSTPDGTEHGDAIIVQRIAENGQDGQGDRQSDDAAENAEESAFQFRFFLRSEMGAFVLGASTALTPFGSLVRMTTRSRQGKGRNPLLASLGVRLTEVKSSKFTVKRNAPKVLFESLGAELEPESGGDAEADDCGCNKQQIDGARKHSADLPEQGEKERVRCDRGYDTDRYGPFFVAELGECPDGGAEDESPERTADEGRDDVGRSQNGDVLNVDSDRDKPSGDHATKQASKFALH